MCHNSPLSLFVLRKPTKRGMVRKGGCETLQRMDASSRRKQLRQARRTKIEHARDVGSQAEFGLTITERRSGLRVQWDVDRDSFVALLALHRLRDGLLAQLEQELVAGLRLQGVSWEEIGWALGVSGEAARKRLRAAEELAERLAAGEES